MQCEYSLKCPFFFDLWWLWFTYAVQCVWSLKQLYSLIIPAFRLDFNWCSYSFQRLQLIFFVCRFLENFQVTRADYLSGRTALHFASVNGHVRCIRLVVTDFVPSAPFEPLNSQTVTDGSHGSSNKTRYRQWFYVFQHPVQHFSWSWYTIMSLCCIESSWLHLKRYEQNENGQCSIV